MIFDFGKGIRGFIPSIKLHEIVSSEGLHNIKDHTPVLEAYSTFILFYCYFIIFPPSVQSE